MIRKETADKIASQSLEEISRARIYKNGKVKNWQENEKMYYGQKVVTTEARANVSLSRMQEFVHTLLSKIDNPLVFNYVKTKPAQLARVELLNALKVQDSNDGFWDLKDIVGKKQAIIYGRAIYAYHASSDNGYQSHLENVDVYDFLIDPAASGIDMETAMNMGRWGIVKSIKQLKEGVKNKIYSKSAVERLLESGGNSDESNQEETNKLSRSYDQNTLGKKEVRNDNKFKFWEWFTTFEGERYYILMDNSGNWIRCELLVDMFSDDKFPFWSYASFPDMTEFWTPSYCDYAREIYQTQEITINQMLDNAEAINKPMRAVMVNAIEDINKLKYRKDGIIPVKGGVDINKAYQPISTTSINTPVEVYNLLENIVSKAIGVSDNSKGVADEKGKVGIYEGNVMAEADRFGLFNKSYSFGYKRFAELYECGIKDHLIKKTAIQILGPNGVEIKQASKRDIYKRNDKYGIVVEASNSELMASSKEKQMKLQFLTSLVNNQMVNQSKVFEMSATIAGLSEEEIRQLLDVNVYGKEKIMAEADRDLESILLGEKIELNDNANNAYKARFVEYLKDHKEDINDEKFFEISAYLDALEPIIMKNEARQFELEQTDALNKLNLNPMETGDAMAKPEPVNQYGEIQA